MSGETTRRTVRIEDGLWEEAQLLARETGDNLSEVIRDALRTYVEHRRQSLQEPVMSIPEVHRLSSVSFAGKRRCTCGKRVEQDADGKWRHIERGGT